MRSGESEPILRRKVGRHSSPESTTAFVVKLVAGAIVLLAGAMLYRGEPAKPTGEQTDATPISAIGTPLPHEAEIYQTPAH